MFMPTTHCSTQNQFNRILFAQMTRCTFVHALGSCQHCCNIFVEKKIFRGWKNICKNAEKIKSKNYWDTHGKTWKFIDDTVKKILELFVEDFQQQPIGNLEYGLVFYLHTWTIRSNIWCYVLTRAYSVQRLSTSRWEIQMENIQRIFK